MIASPNLRTLLAVLIGGFSLPEVASAQVVTQIIDSTGGGDDYLNDPSAITVDGLGNVYVAGFGSDNLFKITPGGVITEIIAKSAGGAGMFYQPAGVAVVPPENPVQAAQTHDCGLLKHRNARRVARLAIAER